MDESIKNHFRIGPMEDAFDIEVVSEVEFEKFRRELVHDVIQCGYTETFSVPEDRNKNYICGEEEWNRGVDEAGGKENHR